ncbi:MAG TPA: GNAT family N-acetyltransferase [Afifellaceae bacterium]|nr:GNAT family N-acetyltransferase [Afifellaceae bacterium]
MAHHDQQDAARSVRVISALSEIDRAEWDSCANPPGTPYNPFVSWDFLHALEEAECVSAGTGWLPQHLVLDGSRDKDRPGIAGVMPCYLKSHSQGEYVFDHGWADAFEAAGGRYYPKLQASVPFTPVTGPRLMVRAGADRQADQRYLGTALAELARRHKVSSAHVTFARDDEWRILSELGYLRRTDQQFHWIDQGYGDFEGFLASLASRKRKAIRKERREALASGLEITWITGADITQAHWDAFFGFYMDTGSRKWGRPYLNRRFFSLLGERLSERVLLIMAHRHGRPVAGALNLIGSDTLYGRYWGCSEDHPCLHFEVCYYQAIEFALASGLARVEAGAQGAHKLARGYMPVTTFSAHYIAEAGFRRAVEDYLKRERQHVAFENEVLAQQGPFRKSDGLDRESVT